ncbi:type IV pilin protein [Candidatus Avelusimicrobium caledoniensis]|uniref:type IV pilin protein n=1 Tax=Candidatus Avelusimicrobium caledoniensis TaxID=3416220 RepID=UPI003D0ECF44
MKNKQAFTLIELLVVVLIIGILAAVAVPQYQFAVDKARVMTHFQNVQAIIKTEQIYKMANGNYTGDFTALDVDWTKTCTLGGHQYSELMHCPGGFSFQMANSDTVPSQIWLRYCNQKSCYSNTTNYHFLMILSTTDGHIISCSSKTTRGQKLCNYFTQQFGNSAQ